MNLTTAIDRVLKRRKVGTRKIWVKQEQDHNYNMVIQFKNRTHIVFFDNDKVDDILKVSV